MNSIKIKDYALTEIPGLRVMGRTNGCLSPLTLFWTASGFSIRTAAEEVWITVKVDYDRFEPWLDILIDGAPVQRLMMTKGTYDICLLRASDASTARTIQVLRDTQAMPEDEHMLLQVLSVKTDGSFLPLEEPERRLEFIGDSITTGEGLCGAPQEMDWVPSSFNCIDSYAHLTAEALHAEYHVLSQCGWGVYCNYEGNKEQIIPPYYEQICGVVRGEQNRVLGAEQPWNFSLFQPDAVIVNLGTNDAGALFNPDIPVTDKRAIEKSAIEFLRKIRHNNPHAHIVWCLGMLGSPLCDVMQAAIDHYQIESGDTNCGFLQLPDTQPNEFGSRSHPGKPAHAHAAEALTAYLRKNMQ